jgi:hypothetical protein
LVDIGFFQELPAYGVEAGSAKRAAMQPIDVSLAHVENASGSRHVFR